MRLGIAGWLPTDPWEVDVAAVERVREAGFSAATLYLAVDHAGVDGARCAAIAAAFVTAGVELAQLGAWMCPVLDADAEARAASRRQRHEVLRVAGALGARSVALGPGTLSPRGGSGLDRLEDAWFPAAENHTAAAFDLLVDELRRDAEVAREAGVAIALECHQHTVLSTPTRTRAVIDAVDSEHVRVTVDPANWLTPLNAYETGPFLDEMFAALGDAVLDAHAKDLVLADALLPQSLDAPPGDGSVDYVRLLGGLGAASPDARVIIEHLEPADVPRARAHLLAAAGAAGVDLR